MRQLLADLRASLALQNNIGRGRLISKRVCGKDRGHEVKSESEREEMGQCDRLTWVPVLIFDVLSAVVDRGRRPCDFREIHDTLQWQCARHSQDLAEFTGIPWRD